MNLQDTSIAVFIAFLSGILPVIHKYFLNKFQPMSLFLYSSFVYFAAVLVFSFSQTETLKRDYAKLTMKDALILAAAILVCGFFVNIIYYTILARNKSHVVSSLKDTAPFFTFLTAILLLGENVGKLGIIGFVLTIMGVTCISLDDNILEDSFFIT